VTLLRRGLERLNGERKPGEAEVGGEEEALRAIVRQSDGDARRALGLLEVVVAVKRSMGEGGDITAEEVAAVSQRQLMYDKSGEEHFNLISALHKTLRSSDPHGALYWLGRMLAAGEDPLYIARRLVRFASEDVGMADPFALNHAMEAMRAYQVLGSPEGELALAQCTAYLAMAPKSNSIYVAYKAVQAEVQASGSLPVPMHLRNAPTKLMKEVGYAEGYTYDHDSEEAFVAKQGLPDELKGRRFYEPGTQGKEGALRDRLARWDEGRAGA